MMLPGRNYESDHTRFMRELLEKRPDLVDRQREGRAMWWDKSPRELAEEVSMDKSSRVAATAYAYDDTNKRS